MLWVDDDAVAGWGGVRLDTRATRYGGCCGRFSMAAACLAGQANYELGSPYLKACLPLVPYRIHQDGIVLDFITVECNISSFTLRDHKFSKSGLRKPADKRVSRKDANRFRDKFQRLQLYIRSRNSKKVTYSFKVV